MKLLIYAVRDLKSNSFTFPHFNNTHGQAIRAFGDLVRNPKSVIAAHPEDYSLFHLGEFDDESGAVKSLPVPVSLASAIEFVPVNGPQRNGAAGVEEVPIRG